MTTNPQPGLGRQRDAGEAAQLRDADAAGRRVSASNDATGKARSDARESLRWSLTP